MTPKICASAGWARMTGSTATSARCRGLGGLGCRLDLLLVLRLPELALLVGLRAALGAVDHVADPQLPGDEEQRDDPQRDEDLAQDADHRGASARPRRPAIAEFGGGLVRTPSPPGSSRSSTEGF